MGNEAEITKSVVATILILVAFVACLTAAYMVGVRNGVYAHARGVYEIRTAPSGDLYIVDKPIPAPD